MISTHFSKLQLRGLNRLGDVVIPGDHEFPSFSSLKLDDHVDRILDYMNDDDRSGLKIVMSLFAFMPKFFIFFILWVTEKAKGERLALAADQLESNYIARQVQYNSVGNEYTQGKVDAFFDNYTWII